jgi:predicted transposase YbfD/YdcC
MDHLEYNNLVELFAALPDPRQARGKRYAWSLILTLISAALVSGAQGLRAISQWVDERRDELCQILAPPRQQLPSASTLRRALRLIDVEDLETRAAALVQARPASPGDRGGPPPLIGLALDGKQITGVNAHGTRVHLLSLTCHNDARVIRQQAIDTKSNEIPAAPQLLAGLDLTNTVVTMDALLTQDTIATQIRQQHGHYLMIAKDNQPSLAAAIALLFTDDGPDLPTDYRAQHQTTEKHHGRLETRTLERSAALNDYLDWPAVGQVLRRTTRVVELKTGVVRQEVSYGLTSLPAATTTPAQVEQVWRGHWTIENRVHYVRDVTFGEDAGRSWTGNTPHALAALRNMLLALLRGQGWTNIADALRHYGAYAQRALTLLRQSPRRL